MGICFVNGLPYDACMATSKLNKDETVQSNKMCRLQYPIKNSPHITLVPESFNTTNNIVHTIFPSFSILLVLFAISGHCLNVRGLGSFLYFYDSHRLLRKIDALTRIIMCSMAITRIDAVSAHTKKRDETVLFSNTYRSFYMCNDSINILMVYRAA